MNTKTLLLDAITDKLRDTGVDKIVIMFNLEEETHTVMAKTNDNQTINFEVTQQEISTLKKLFIRRLVNKWNSKFDEAKVVAIEVELIKRELNVFIQTKKNGLMFKYDYI